MLRVFSEGRAAIAAEATDADADVADHVVGHPRIIARELLRDEDRAARAAARVEAGGQAGT